VALPPCVSLTAVATGTFRRYRVPQGCRPDAVPLNPAQSRKFRASSLRQQWTGTFVRTSAEDGRLRWDFDTAREFDIVNHVPACGGSIDGPGAVVAGGMVFINSGYLRNGGLPLNVLLARVMLMVIDKIRRTSKAPIARSLGVRVASHRCAKSHRVMHRSESRVEPGD
jgi:hypothetical protein